MKYSALFIIIFTFNSLAAQTTFHGDNARTGISGGSLPEQITGVNWKFKTEGPIVSSPAIAYGLVFIGSADNYLYAIDEKDGKQKWKFKTVGNVSSSPAVSDSIVCFGSTDGSYYAVNTNTGVLKW
jgi:outer membrane protein assembly factor BamB